MNLGVRLFGHDFRNPVFMAAGSCGFVREVARVLDVEALGGFVTKSVTVEPRAGNAAPRVTEYGRGMLNSVGLANPGLAQVRKTHLPWIAHNLKRPQVFVSVAGRTAADYARIAATLHDADGFLGYELNLSCPNALTGGHATIAHDPDAVAAVVAACRRATDRPLAVKLGPDLGDPLRSAVAAENAGADALTLVNTLPMSSGKLRRAAFRLGSGAGGLSGPPLRPHALRALAAIRGRLPVVAVGGIHRAADAVRYGRAGAALVQVCTGAFADPRTPARVVNGLRRWRASPRARSWTELSG